jgi:hypothetical protein
MVTVAAGGWEVPVCEEQPEARARDIRRAARTAAGNQDRTISPLPGSSALPF